MASRPRPSESNSSERLMHGDVAQSIQITFHLSSFPIAIADVLKRNLIILNYVPSSVPFPHYLRFHPRGSSETTSFKVSRFFRLQARHNNLRFSVVVVPPLAWGIM